MLPPERLSTGQWVPPWVRHQHMARYEYAAALAVDRVVVDVACGNGMCARHLSEGGARRVDGFDLSPEAVREATLAAATLENVCLQVADAARLPVRDAAYDLFVSFETIEHIDGDRAFLAEVVRVLKPGGAFLCSTPNRSLLDPGTSIRDKPFNPFHAREYTLEELEPLLRHYFASVNWLGQSFYGRSYCKILNRIGRFSPKLAVRMHQARKCLTMPLERKGLHRPTRLGRRGEPEILIAICETGVSL
ncbi:MAG TPA: class I SAM-dependent methyltransferase [Pirellulales bacterium]|nr:class I SAM-dependent methyltransferase [Pirellulales bacterium]